MAKQHEHDKPPTTDSNVNSKTSEKNTTEKKRECSGMTRQLSFFRPWSSYVENYSSCLSALQRSSSEQLMKMQNSLESPPTSISEDLTKSLDNGQLRKLKATTTDSETTQDMSKISAIHARPFHQRRWSSPVAFSGMTLASQNKATTKRENGSQEMILDGIKDYTIDKICEATEIISSRDQNKTPVLTAQDTCDEAKAPKSNVTEEVTPERFDPASSGHRTSISRGQVAHFNVNEEREVWKTEGAKMTTEIQPRYANDKTNPDVEDPTSIRNIYTEIKKNTNWSRSKGFRRRYHTIHADSRKFLNPTLFTIAEQSSGSFGGGIQLGGRYESHRMNAKLMSKRSRSLGDLNIWSDDMQTDGVSVQQLCSKPICVPVASNKYRSEDKTSTTDQGREALSGASKKHTSCPAVQVHIQTFNKIQITPGVECKKPQDSKMKPFYNPTQQHVVFTQPKAKWTSITISQV